jgi:hypothetical protein
LDATPNEVVLNVAGHTFIPTTPARHVGSYQNDIIPGSSPSMPIEIEDLEDMTNDMDAIETIELEDDDLVERYFQTMPYSSVNSNPEGLAKGILKHVVDQTELDKNLISSFANWFEAQDMEFRHQNRYWMDLYDDQYITWRHLAHMLEKVYCKK